MSVAEKWIELERWSVEELRTRLRSSDSTRHLDISSSLVIPKKKNLLQVPCFVFLIYGDWNNPISLSLSVWLHLFHNWVSYNAPTFLLSKKRMFICCFFAFFLSLQHWMVGMWKSRRDRRKIRSGAPAMKMVRWWVVGLKEKRSLAFPAIVVARDLSSMGRLVMHFQEQTKKKK